MVSKAAVCCLCTFAFAQLYYIDVGVGIHNCVFPLYFQLSEPTHTHAYASEHIHAKLTDLIAYTVLVYEQAISQQKYNILR